MLPLAPVPAGCCVPAAGPPPAVPVLPPRGAAAERERPRGGVDTPLTPERTGGETPRATLPTALAAPPLPSLRVPGMAN